MKIPFISKFLSWIKNRGKTTDQAISTESTTVEASDHEKPLQQNKKTSQPLKTPQKKPATAKNRKTKPPPPKWDPSEFVVDPEEGKSRFHDIKIPDAIMHGIFDLGFNYCTDIQKEILPKAIDGSDVVGQAQTGTGKSAAFLITILTRLYNKPIHPRRFKGTPRALILAPTRELVLQIEKDCLGLGKHTPFKFVSVFGGLGYEKQRNSLSNRYIDIVVATPGRLIDFHKKGVVKLNHVEFLVIDEADRMLDMGFIPDIKQIVYSTPEKSTRQTMFFSATLNSEVERYARQWTRDPARVEIDPDHVASENIDQIVYIVTSDEKFPLLFNLIQDNNLARVIIFVNRKDQSRFISDKLNSHDIKSAVISGDITQHKRLRALDDFKRGNIRALVATDVAARGIHIDDISHVINYNIPQDPEHYIHRIGRTGRAGSHGTSISFACEDDSFYIPAIEGVLGSELKCEYPEPSLLKELPAPVKKVESSGEKRKRPPQGRRNNNYRKNSKKYGRPPQNKKYRGKRKPSATHTGKKKSGTATDK